MLVKPIARISWLCYNRVCIKTRSPPASLALKDQVTRHTTVKWPISYTHYMYVRSIQKLMVHFINPSHLPKFPDLNYEPLYGYLRTSILARFFHQINELEIVACISKIVLPRGVTGI